jgi:hypothetical protein
MKFLDKKSIEAAFKRHLAPEAPTPVIAKASGETKITARLDYSKVGVCPYCGTPMGKVRVNDQMQYLCEKDRFVSPLENMYLES